MSAETSAPSSPGNALHDPKRLGRLITGVVMLLVFAGYFVSARELSQGDLSSPGPGMFPTWVGLGGIVVAVIVVLESLLGRCESGEIGFPRGSKLRDVAVFVAFVTGYVLVLPVLGQYLASLLFAAGLIWAVSSLNWWKAILLGVAMALLVSVFFSEVLGLNLPSGLI